MNEPVTHMRTFDIRNATPAEYAAHYAYVSQMRRERLPDDPPFSLEASILAWRNVPDFVELSLWTIWNESETTIIAHADAAIFHMETNQHILLYLWVYPIGF